MSNIEGGRHSLHGESFVLLSVVGAGERCFYLRVLEPELLNEDDTHACLLCRMLRVTIAGASPAIVIYFSSDVRMPPFHLVGAGGGCISRCESAKE